MIVVVLQFRLYCSMRPCFLWVNNKSRGWRALSELCYIVLKMMNGIDLVIVDIIVYWVCGFPVEL